MTTDPVIVSLLPPSLLQLSEGLLQDGVRPDLLRFRFLDGWEMSESHLVLICTLAEVKRR